MIVVGPFAECIVGEPDCPFCNRTREAPDYVRPTLDAAYNPRHLPVPIITVDYQDVWIGVLYFTDETKKAAGYLEYETVMVVPIG